MEKKYEHHTIQSNLLDQPLQQWNTQLGPDLSALSNIVMPKNLRRHLKAVFWVCVDLSLCFGAGHWLGLW